MVPNEKVPISSLRLAGNALIATDMYTDSEQVQGEGPSVQTHTPSLTAIIRKDEVSHALLSDRPFAALHPLALC